MQSFVGIVLILILCWLSSEDKRRFPWKLAAMVFVFQILFYLVTKVPALTIPFSMFNRTVLTLADATKEGSSFIFGYLGGGELPFEARPGVSTLVIAFEILPIVIVVSALSALLFHWRILQFVVKGFSFVFQRFLKLESVTSVGVALSIFFGIIETPLLIRPYLHKLSRSGLFTVLASSMSTISGAVLALYTKVLVDVLPNPGSHLFVATVLSAPAAILIAQIMVPSKDSTVVATHITIPVESKSSFDALMRGTMDGVQIAINIAGVIIVMFALVYLVNHLLGWISGDTQLNIQTILGYVFTPFCWCMGIPWSECANASQLMATKTILNEFVAYLEFAKIKETFSSDTRLILTYAMCGFSNLGSVGIVVGGLGTILPERREEVIQLTVKAMFAGTAVSMLVASVVGCVSSVIS